MLFTEGTIKQSMGIDAFIKGCKYQEQNRVLDVTVDPANMKLKGIVHGKSMPRYEIVINVEKYSVSGICTCPVHRNCKHCVAVCIEWLRNPGRFHILEDFNDEGITKRKLAQFDEASGNEKVNVNSMEKERSKNEKEDERDEDEEIDECDDEEDEHVEDEDERSEDEDEDDDEPDEDEDDDEPDEDEDEDEPDEDEEDDENRSSKRKKGSRVVIVDKINPPGTIPGDLNFHAEISTRAIFDSITFETLKEWFVKAWQRNYPASEKPFFQDGAYFRAWMGTIARIDYYEPPVTGDYDTAEEVGEGTSFQESVPYSDWIGPLDLLSMISDEELVQKLLKSWFSDYVKLGWQIKEEFKDRGLIKGRYKVLFEYYEDFIKSIVKVDDSDDDDYNRFHRGHDYDDDDGDYEVSNREVIKFTENFLKRITILLIEIARFTNTLLKNNMIEHAEFVKESAISWIYQVPEPTTEKWPEISPRIAVVKAAVSEELDRQRITEMTMKDRVTFRVSELNRAPSKELSDAIVGDCKNAKDPAIVTMMYHQALNSAFPGKAEPWMGMCWIKIAQMYARDLLEDTLKVIASNICTASQYNGIKTVYLEALKTMPVEFTVANIQDPLIKAIESLQVEPYMHERLVEQTIRWFVMYYKEHEAPQHAIAMYHYFALSHPKSFTREDFNNLDTCFQDAYLDAKVEIAPFLDLLQDQGNVGEIVPVLIVNGRNDDALRILTNRGNETSWKQFLHEILLNNPAIDENISNSLTSQLKKKVSEMVDGGFARRQDDVIAEFIDCIRLLSNNPPRDRAETEWKRWFARFWSEHKSLRNLRKALVAKGLL
ncbi:MAG TPA: hypothetical protein VKM55_25195 [Candidatus Lokiarchaeia archaeon]|nr:hypothetical protein [Candidatus Lokiarchaeia archaeon]